MAAVLVLTGMAVLWFGFPARLYRASVAIERSLAGVETGQVNVGDLDWRYWQGGSGDTLVWDAADHELIIAYGTHIAADATVTHLEDSQISLTATDTWISPNNGTEYPMGWVLSVADPPLALRLDPVREDAEFAGSSYVPVPYWEGVSPALLHIPTSVHG